MPDFIPCRGKSACRDDGTCCLTCGRSLAEITRLRELLNQLAALALEFQYDNSAEFSAYVARKLEKMLDHRRREDSTDARPD